MKVAVENAEEFAVDLAAADIIKRLQQERIEPAPGGRGLIGVVDGVVAVVGEILDGERPVFAARRLVAGNEIADQLANAVIRVVAAKKTTSVIEANPIDLPDIEPILANVSYQFFSAGIVVVEIRKKLARTSDEG